MYMRLDLLRDNGSAAILARGRYDSYHLVRRFGAFVGLLFGVAFLGCDAKSPLLFRESVEDVGVVNADGKLSAEFHFEVVHTEGVRLHAVMPSCSCMSVSADGFLGKHLSKGDVGCVGLTINADDVAGDLQGEVVVLTEPEATAPIILTVRGRVLATRLQLNSAVPVHVDALPNTRARFEITVERLRALTESALVLDRNRSGGPTHTVVSNEVTERQVVEHGLQVSVATRELHRIVVEGEAMSQIGNVDSKINLVWRDTDEALQVPIVTRVNHPLQLTDDHIFMGYMAPSETKEVVVCPLNPSAMIQSLQSVECKEAFASAELNETKGSVRLRVAAPTNPGRFESALILSCKPVGSQAIPALQIPITGIVRSSPP